MANRSTLPPNTMQLILQEWQSSSPAALLRKELILGEEMERNLMVLHANGSIFSVVYRKIRNP